jgi:hypothetical protein
MEIGRKKQIDGDWQKRRLLKIESKKRLMEIGRRKQIDGDWLKKTD